MATATKPKPKKDKKRPVHEVRIGRVRAAIWENETENGTFFNVTLSRLYKDGEPYPLPPRCAARLDSEIRAKWAEAFHDPPT